MFPGDSFSLITFAVFWSFFTGERIPRPPAPNTPGSRRTKPDCKTACFHFLAFFFFFFPTLGKHTLPQCNSSNFNLNRFVSRLRRSSSFSNMFQMHHPLFQETHSFLSNSSLGNLCPKSNFRRNSVNF